MESSGQKRRFPPPWKIEQQDADTFVVCDANDIPVAFVPCRDDLKNVQFYHRALTSDEARRIAKAIARLPEFLMKRNDFHPRGSGKTYRIKRPYHVALEDMYVREHYDWIATICKFNRVPFDATSERIGTYVVHEFAVQLEAMMFWEEFNGRWLIGDEFVFPERPAGLPKMKRHAHWEKLFRQTRRD